MTYRILWLWLLLAVPSWVFATEVEPNDVNPQSIVFEESIVGELSSSSDIDKYALEAAGAGTITLSFASTLSSSYGWEIQLRDSAGNVLSATDCSSYSCQDGISVPVGISAAGTYTIVIKSQYTNTAPDGTYTVSASYSTATDNIEFEPNDTSVTANLLELPVTIIASLSSENDADWFSFSTTERRMIQYDFSMLARNSTVFIISVFDASLNLLEVDECSGDCFDNGFSKTLALVLSGQYYLLIESSSYRFSNAQYQLLVKSVALPEIPSKPLSVTASNKTTQDYITVNWSIVPEASSYELYRANEGGSPQFVLDVFDNRYVDQSVVLDSVYHYWVKAKNIAGVSVLSEYAVGQLGSGPSIINDVSISNVDVTKLTLDWSAPAGPLGNADVVKDYEIRYSNTELTASNWNSAALVKPVTSPREPGLSEQYVLTGLIPSQKYWIGIKSISSINLISDISNVVTANTLPILKINPEQIRLSVEPDQRRNLAVSIENISDTLTVDYALSIKGTGASATDSSVSLGAQRGQASARNGGEARLATALLENHTRWIIKIKASSSKSDMPLNKREIDTGVRTSIVAMATSLNGVFVREIQNSGLQIWNIDNKNSSKLQNFVNTLNENSDIEYIEPDYKVSIGALPDDPKFNDLWGLVNSGQNSGLVDADIDAEQAWEITSGSKDIVVGVIDTGVDYKHSDLVENIWVNSGEIANNGVDDDRNGFVDDVYGYSFIDSQNGDPLDDQNHGTHCAGTIGAMAGNSYGVVGVNHNVSIMALKFLGDGGGYISDAIEAVYYAVDNGARVLSNSWGGGGFSQSMLDAITYAAENDVLFVAAAGNSSSDNDKKPHYPSNYDVPNVISVAATTRKDKKAGFSCYGQNTVHLGAPGQDIMSTVIGNKFDSYSGTSMATPHVAGAAALLLANNPSLTALEVKQLLLENVDYLDALSGITITGGRLNIHKALLADTPDWMTIASNKSGSIGPGETINLELLVDTTRLSLKTYQAQLEVSLKSPFVARRFIPITLSVEETNANATSTSASLAAPENVRITSARLSSSINLAWSDSIGSSSYEIYRSVNSVDLGGLINSVTSASYTDATAATDTGYYYTIAARNTSYSAKSGPVYGVRTDKISDIQLSEEPGAEDVKYVGDQIVHKLSYLNNGQYEILIPRLKFETPQHTVLSTVSSSSGSCMKIDNATHCVLDKLVSGDSAAIEVVLEATGAGKSSIIYTATSDVSDPVDQNLSNNTVVNSFEILAKSDIQISLKKINSPNENVNIREFNIKVKNDGPSIAGDISINLKHSGLGNITLIPDRGNCSNVVFGEFNCEIDTLAKSETSNIYLQISGNETASLKIVASEDTDILLSNNSVLYEFTAILDTDGDGISDQNDPFPLNSVYSADSDGDGMPDAWETRYGLNPNDASDATSDIDNDGVSALDEFLAGTIPSGSLDIDGNAQYDALTDGLLLLRGMFGLDGTALVTGTIASDAAYTESVDIESRIATLGDLADIDGNGQIDALTDGLLTLRYLFGLQGDTLINGVVADDATRNTAEEIESHLKNLMPAL